MKTFKQFRHLVAITAAVAAAITFTPNAFAGDKLTLKDGKVVEGEIIRELDGVIWLKTALGTQMYSKSEYTKVERQATTPGAQEPAKDSAKDPGKDPVKTEPASPAGEKKEAKNLRKPGVPRAAVVTFGDEENGDMVGIFCTADSFKKSMKLLEEEQVDICIVRFKSGGGALLEIQKLSDVFHDEYKKKFRTVAWIDSAISAAAMSAHCFEEIYFTPQGNYGACTGFSGRLNAMKGLGLEQVLYMMEKISARGNYDPKIMRAMQISSEQDEIDPLGISTPNGALSASVDPVTNKVTYYGDQVTGDIVLNPKGGVHILTFDSVSAAQVKFSRGTAKNLDELSKAMGLTEVEWVGKPDKRFVYPVCKAEEYMLSFRKQTKVDQDGFQRYYRNYVSAINRAAAQENAAERGKFLGEAKRNLNLIRAMVKNNPNFILFNWGDQEEYDKWIAEQERIIKELSAGPR